MGNMRRTRLAIAFNLPANTCMHKATLRTAHWQSSSPRSRHSLLQHGQPLVVCCNQRLLLRQRLPHATQLVWRHRDRPPRRARRGLANAAQLALQRGKPRAQCPRILLQRRRSRLERGQLLRRKALLRLGGRPRQRPVQLGQQAQSLAQVLLLAGGQAGVEGDASELASALAHRGGLSHLRPVQEQGTRPA